MKPITGFRVSAPIRWSLRISVFLFIALTYGANRSRPAGGIEPGLSAALVEGFAVAAYLYLLFYVLVLSIHWFVTRISNRDRLADRA